MLRIHRQDTLLKHIFYIICTIIYKWLLLLLYTPLAYHSSYTGLHVFMCVCVCVYECVCTYTCVYACMLVCMHIALMHTHTHTARLCHFTIFMDHNLFLTIKIIFIFLLLRIILFSSAGTPLQLFNTWNVVAPSNQPIQHNIWKLVAQQKNV